MRVVVFALMIVLVSPPTCLGGAELSDATAECLECHSSIAPGLVADWQKSRHAMVSPAEALEKAELSRRISTKQLPDKLARSSVGCAECHTLNPEKHRDTFEHNGYRVHVVVSPRDCATCHPVELKQFGRNLMSQAYGNLQNNPLYRDLAQTINGVLFLLDGKLELRPPSTETEADSCLACHGTAVEVEGFEPRQTQMGEMTFPILGGWPNQGVGRINPDGSKGSCTACHTRHSFSIAMARRPATCSQCHKGPDVPAYKVYQVSKHGNIYAASGKKWNFQEVPWTVGKDFSAPTCAACHISLVVTEEGGTVAPRTHQMNDRLPWRIFGLIYAHAHPKSAQTSVIRNKAGLPLPTDLGGEPASAYLISNQEQQLRRAAMQKVCLACHSRAWVEGVWARFDNTINTTNEMTLTATGMLLQAWAAGAARGLAQHDSIFNEAIEKKWVEQWMFFANSTRFSAAMLGTDYGVFANGRWFMAKNLQEIRDWLRARLGKDPEKAVPQKP